MLCLAAAACTGSRYGAGVPATYVPKAVAYLTESAQQGNQYAQYTLGKLYLTGQDVQQDRKLAWTYFYESAEQGNQYANFFLDHFDQVHRPNVFLSATRLLHHLSQIFRDNSVPPAAPVGQRVDRKLRPEKLRKEVNDHEGDHQRCGKVGRCFHRHGFPHHQLDPLRSSVWTMQGTCPASALG